MTSIEDGTDLASLDSGDPHAAQVCRLALQLFDATVPLHGLGLPARRILQAAALLHDIGLAFSAKQHHKHAQALIRKRNLPGFVAHERDLVACVARYHRKALPKPEHPVYGDLSAEDQRCVQWLAGLLRIADGLDRAHDAAVRRVTVRILSGRLEIEARLARPHACAIEGARRKRDLLESVTGRIVAIVAQVTPSE